MMRKYRCGPSGYICLVMVDVPRFLYWIKPPADALERRHDAYESILCAKAHSIREMSR